MAGARQPCARSPVASRRAVVGPRYSRGFFSAGGFVKFLALIVAFFVLLAWLLDDGSPAQTSPPTPTPAKLAVPEIREVSRGETKYYGIDTDGKRGILCRAAFYTCAAYWKAEDINLVTSKDHPLVGLSYLEDTLWIWPWNRSGKEPLEVINPRFNCHGYTFAQSEYWINDPQALLNDFYVRLKDEAQRGPGDAVVYRDPQSGEIAHSAILRAPASDPRLDTVSSKGGKEPTVLVLARGPGPGTAWADDAAVAYYRHK
jgi:hypothetical protein